MKRIYLYLFLLLPVACSKKVDLGVPGKDGTQIYSGTTTPAVSQGTTGDYYLDVATGALYGPKTDSGWGTPIQIQGSNGVPGSQIYSGTTVPATTLGSIGDYYLDKTTEMLYGPKTTNGWGVPITLQGPQGEQGAQGNANVKTLTVSLTNAQWGNEGDYRLQTDNFGSADGNDDRYVNVPFSALTKGILDSGMVLVYFTPDPQEAPTAWQPLPYQLYDNGTTFNYTYLTNVGTVQLVLFFTSVPDAGWVGDINTFFIATYKYKFVAVSGTTVTEMKRQQIDFSDYSQVSKFIQ